MKPIRILLIIIISVFLFMGTMLHAQNPSVTRNEDGSINKEIVIMEFSSLLDTLQQFPQSDDEANTLIRNFIFGLFPEDVRIYDKNHEDLSQSQINNDCYTELAEILSQRMLSQQEPSEKDKDIDATKQVSRRKWLIIALICCLTLLVAALIIIVNQSKRKKAKPSVPNMITNPSPEGNDSGIVVRRKTTSVMRKQSLDDVIGNNNYMVIDGQDFCNDSKIRRMYIKNSCIKEIYNMYADDLRNPNNPKEDGCMVLGRWVFNEKSNSYDVSLEEIVHPGDDAIFSEYELNFGGKIKLKVSEKLKKLRRETELQYDLTCWVHSHPGLGVFFSNSDCNVQAQLKHPSHPHFLTAFVIDILTPQQELGVFTFKQDSNIASKADLKRLYSLEEWYKWALESELNAFKPEDYFNTLANAKMHLSECYAIELNNNVIIDIGMLLDHPKDETTRLIHGFVHKLSDKVENVAVKMSESDTMADNELIGAFIVESHCSIPSVRKALSNRLSQVRFVLVYSTTDGMLTSIPVINNDLIMDDTCYGTQKLEDLKIWTRRKR